MKTSLLRSPARALTAFSVASFLMMTALVAAPAPAAGAKPDLVASGSARGADSAGKRVAGSYKVKNTGRRRAAASKARVQLTAGSNALTIREQSVPALAKGTSRKFSAAAAVPSAVPPGTYGVRVCVDVTSAVKESKEGNNCRSIGNVVVRASSSIPTGPFAYQADASFLRGTSSSGYYGWVPTGYDDSHQTPSQLFVWLHGCGGQSKFDIANLAPDPTDDYVMIAPTGAEGGCWNTSASGAGDDAKVLDAIAAAKTSFNIDPHQVVLGGYSSGGDLAYRVAYRNSTKIAGVLIENSSPFRDTGLTAAQALAAAQSKFHVVHLAHTGDTTYALAGVQAELQQLVDAGFPVTAVERPGTHYDDPGDGLPGTYADARTYLLPALDLGWMSPGT